MLRLVLGAAEALFFMAGFALLADIAHAGRAGTVEGAAYLAPLEAPSAFSRQVLDFCWAGHAAVDSSS